jgi:hypothetical protein
MVKASNRDGVIYKLKSPSGTLLGTIAIPAHWENNIRRYGRVEFEVREQVCFRDHASVGAWLHEPDRLLSHRLHVRSGGGHDGRRAPGAQQVTTTHAVLLSLGGVIAANIFIVIFIWVKFLRQGRFFDGK